MIVVHKLNGQQIAVNDAQIECIEQIPESKIVMMNGRFHVVSESIEEIIQKTIEYNGVVSNFVDNRQTGK